MPCLASRISACICIYFSNIWSCCAVTLPQIVVVYIASVLLETVKCFLFNNVFFIRSSCSSTYRAVGRNNSVLYRLFRFTFYMLWWCVLGCCDDNVCEPLFNFIRFLIAQEKRILYVLRCLFFRSLCILFYVR